MRLAVLLLVVLACARPAFAEVIDVMSMQPDFYSKPAKKDYTDSAGRRIRIENTDAAKGTYIEVTENKNKKWKLHGVYYEYTDKILRVKTTYSMGVKDGLREEYTAKKKLLFRKNYKNDLYQGKYQQFNDKEELVLDIDYVDGKRHGKQCRYSKNIKTLETDFVNDLKHGELLGYTDKGKLLYREKYEKDKQVGDTQWYKN
jgi:antitoxin component YwqK of YwqJK toxin-antitoxin module